MRSTISLLTALICLSCGGDSDDNPMGPGEELVGTWNGVSTTASMDADLFRSQSIVFRADGTATESVVAFGRTVSHEATWDIVGGKLLMGPFTIKFTLNGNRLTLVHELGPVSVYERDNSEVVHGSADGKWVLAGVV